MVLVDPTSHKNEGARMKRLVIPLMVMVVAVGTLSLAPQATAATTSQGPAAVGKGWTAFSPALGSVQHQVNVANRAFANQHPTGVGQASIQVGWGTVLLTLNHSEVGNSLWQGYFLGEAAVLAYACGFLPGWVTTAACIFGMAVLWNQIISAMNAAWNRWTWYVPIGQCGTWGGYAYWGEPPCNLPYAHTVLDFFGRPYWVALHQVSGLNILFTWAGIPVAWQVNDFSG